MSLRGFASWVTVALAVLLAGCGAGSGRAGTDLAVTGVGPSAQVNGGDPAVFVMTVTNQGPYTAEDVVVRNTTLQLSQSVLAITCSAAGGATCPAQTGPSMSVGSLPAGGSLVFQVASTANLGANGSISNTMSVSAGTPDTNTGNNAVTVSGAVSSNDVAVTATAPPGPLLSGPATFTAVVSNTGPDTASNVVLTTTVGANLTLDPAAVVCVPSGGAVAPVLQSDGTLLSAAIPLNGVLTCSIPVTVGPGSGSFALVSMAAAALGDSRASNNSATATVSAALTNDVSVVGTAPAGPLLTGSATFSMLVGNAGPDTASNVVLTTTVSADLTLARDTITCAPSGGASAPALQPDGSLLVATLPSGAALNCSIPVTIAAASSSFAVVSMTATSPGDARLGNNSATASVSATLTNDVAVSGTAPAGPLTTGTATFTMVVTNGGPATANNVVLTNTVGPNLTLAAPIACAASAGAVAPTLQPDGTLLSPAIPVGGVLSCSVPVNVAAGTTATVFNTMTVSALGDLRAGNNSASPSVSATLSNNVAVSGTALAPSVIGGQATTFTMVVSNSGPSTAFDVALSNTLSPNLTLSGAIVCVANGGAVAPVATPGGGLSSPSIPVGGVLTCTLPLTVAAGANGTVTATFTATAAGDQRVIDNSATVSTVAVSSNLGVSQTGASQVAAGSSTTFTALVSNPGPGTASNLQISWSHSSATDVVFDNPTCTATAGATCPAVLGPTMTVPSLGAGRTLVFSFNATPGANFRGTLVNTVAVTSTEDQDLSNNAASATTLVVDLRNGTYTAFAANGRSYNLAIDFDAGQYTMAGNATSTTRSFTPETSTGDFVVSGTARLRVAQDLLIGGHDFGAGVLPFIAARSFTPGLGALAGSYNLATRNVDGAGVATTRPGTALISGNTLSICQNESVDVAQVRNCVASSRKDYLNLTISGNVVTGTATSGETYAFSLASSGGAKVLLSAGAAVDGSDQFRVGLIDSTAGYTYGPALRGPSSTGDWLRSTLTFGTPPVFDALGSSSSDTVSLQLITNNGSGPFSMLKGTSLTYNASVYVMQAYPLVIVVGGAPAYAGASSGFLQLGLP